MGMENPLTRRPGAETEDAAMTTSPYKIALIVPYFGPLPSCFPVWLQSAQANADVDFLFYTDQEVEINAPNFRVTKTTLDDLRKRFERTLNRPLAIPNGYKLCDYRPAYGVLFADELRGYDFWGHCDVDMALGHIRHFLTDELLSAYERFYAYGPLSVYRNSEKMNRAFELPGSWFTLDEMFGPVHIGIDEFSGINRICIKNRIPWYTAIDFALLSCVPKTRMNISRQQKNYPAQIFYYRDGRAFQRYAEKDEIRERELLFIHWFRRVPSAERPPNPGEAVVVTAEKLLVRSPQDLTLENMRRWNPPASRADLFLGAQKWRLRHYAALFNPSHAARKIWWKLKLFSLLERHLKKLPYP